jgi:hypothetical protein
MDHRPLHETAITAEFDTSRSVWRVFSVQKTPVPEDLLQTVILGVFILATVWLFAGAPRKVSQFFGYVALMMGHGLPLWFDRRSSNRVLRRQASSLPTGFIF